MTVSRWTKRLFNVSAALSALLLILVIAAWVRSYFATDVVRFQPRIDYVLHAYAAGWGRGYLAIAAEQARGPNTSVLYLESEKPKALTGAWFAREQWFHVAGVRFATRDNIAMINTPVREYMLYVPCWVAALLSAALPGAWLMRARRRSFERRRLEAGQCVRCGYDLRASPGGCPECGAAALA